MLRFTRIHSQILRRWAATRPSFSANMRQCVIQKAFTSTHDGEQKHLIKDNSVDEHVRQVDRYFSQYVDEYYEEQDDVAEEDDAEETESDVQLFDKKLISEITVGELVNLLEEFRAQDITVVDVVKENSPYKQVIVCAPYNDKHGAALMENVRKYVKQRYYYQNKVFPQKSEMLNGWFLFDMRSIVLHIMNKDVRERYGLEQFYTEQDVDLFDIDPALVPAQPVKMIEESTENPNHAHIVAKDH